MLFKKWFMVMKNSEKYETIEKYTKNTKRNLNTKRDLKGDMFQK